MEIENSNDFKIKNRSILSFRGTRNLHEKLYKGWILVTELLKEIPSSSE